MEQITIAIDGPSGAGKSTIAKALSRELGISYIDTGAMYRGIAYGALKEGIKFNDDKSLKKMLEEISLGFNDEGHITLNGEDIEGEIRREEISKSASRLSQKDFIRKFSVDLQRELARSRSVVMEGRDIGTVVLPNADFKFFLTASEEVRGKRRWNQLKETGADPDYETILKDIIRRDKEDTTREHSPLRKAEDGIVIDSSLQSPEETVKQMVDIIRSKT